MKMKPLPTKSDREILRSHVVATAVSQLRRRKVSFRDRPRVYSKETPKFRLRPRKHICLNKSEAFRIAVAPEFRKPTRGEYQVNRHAERDQQGDRRTASTEHQR